MSHSNRQLAAIMFTDIVGYTALMGSDENKAMSVLKDNRSIHKSIIRKHHGKWLKEMGDGTLAKFKTISDAVYCAGEIIKSCKENNIQLRIAIHQGEVIEEDGDIFGDGVNVASRLEVLANPDEILVSGPIHRNIKNKSGITSTYLGEKELKNVDEPIRVYNVTVDSIPNATKKSKNIKKPIIIAAGLALAILIIYSLASYFDIEKPVKTSSLEKSIAVLPFKNLSTNEGDQYLADGVMEAILNHLQRIEDLSLRSRTSTEPYRDSPKNIREIGEELQVNYILEGSFQKVGNQANLVVQLISTKNDEHLWADEYNRDWSEIFIVQKEVAILIADELHSKLTDEARKGIEVIPTTSIDAYELYLKGNDSFWSYWNDRDNKKLNKSVKYFRDAIELDGDFSLAYTGLTKVFKILARNSDNELERIELRKDCREYLTKAIQLDPYNGLAYAQLGVISNDWDLDTAIARKNFKRALKLEPNNPESLNAYFHFEARFGSCQKATMLAERITKIIPDASKPFSEFKLKLLECQNNYYELAMLADKYLNEIPHLTYYRLYFLGYLYTDQFDKANRVIGYIKEKSTENDFHLWLKAMLEAKKGDRKSTIATLDSMKLKGVTVGYAYYAGVYAALGDKELMYENLEQAISNDRERLRRTLSHSQYYPYKNEPRFQEIVRKAWMPKGSIDD